MKISVISFTRAGAVKNLELVGILQKNNHQAVSYSWHKYTGRKLIPFQSLKLLFRDLWENQDVFLFVWDLEHTARAVIPCFKQRGRGPAVFVTDENGRFVIPLLAGKMPGADAWCSRFAQLADAVAVVAPLEQKEERFDADLFARKNRLHIQDIFRIRTIAARLSAGEPVGIYSDYPVEGVLPDGLVGTGTVMNCGGRDEGTVLEAGIAITDDWEAPHFAKECRMFPRNLAMGMLCAKQTDAAKLEQFAISVLTENHLSRERLCGLFSVGNLKDAPGLKALADKLHVPFFTYEKEQVSEGEAEAESVCEGCARLGSDHGKKLTGCRKKDGMLACVYEKEAELFF